MKLKFPKENARHTQLLNRANDLIREDAQNADNLRQMYAYVEECANEKSPRGNYCKALTLYFFDEAGSYKNEILSALDLAIKGKYPLAEDLKVDYLAGIGEERELYRALRSGKGGFNFPFYAAGFAAGYFDFKPESVNYKKAAKLFKECAEICLEYDAVKQVYCDEFDDLFVRTGRSDYFKTQAGNCYFRLMYVYSNWDFKENKEDYLAAYRAAQSLGSPQDKYLSASQYADDCMRNVMGMHSLKTVNAILKTVNERYGELDESAQEQFKEDYDGVWSLYDEFYEYEQERLAAVGNIEVYSSPEFAKQNSISASEIIHSVGDAINKL